MIIDAHVHLWEKQKGILNGNPVYSIGNGKSDFGGEVRQMMPPYLIDGKNTVEYLIANMDYAQVNCAVVTQEYIDGNQDSYLLEARKKYQDRIKVCSLYEENDDFNIADFDGIKICAARLKEPFINTLKVFKEAERLNKFVSIDMAEGISQVDDLKKIIKECPNVKIAIGHFGMVTKEGWLEQVKLAENPNVYIESGGITWLFNSEFYPYPSAIDAILKAKELVGIEKLMWGSDYPRTMTAITYRMAQDFITKSNKLSSHEKRLFLGENAEKFYGFTHQEMIPYTKNMVED